MNGQPRKVKAFRTKEELIIEIRIYILKEVIQLLLVYDFVMVIETKINRIEFEAEGNQT